MAQDLTTTTTKRTISRQEAEVKIEELHGRLEAHPAHPNRFCVPRPMAATTTEQRQLCAVRERLERDLAPCEDARQVEAAVARLLLGFDLGRGLAPEDAEDLRAEYVEAVAGLPLVAVVEAAARFRRGKTLTAWKRGYRPNTGEFAEEARVGLEALRVKLIRTCRVLEAEVYDPPTENDKAKVAAAMAKFHEELRQRGAEIRAASAGPIKRDPTPEILANAAALRADLEARRRRREELEQAEQRQGAVA